MKDPPKTINVRQFRGNPAEFGKIQKKQRQNGAISQHPERVTVQKKLIPAITFIALNSLINNGTYCKSNVGWIQQSSRWQVVIQQTHI